MDYHKHRAGRLAGCTAAALAAFATPAAQAQQTPAQQTPSPAPAPAPTPSPTRSGPPNVMYLPNVVPERFSIGGAPTPTPTPSPVPVPPPVAVPTPAARAGTPAARSTQTAPREAAPATMPSATPTPEALPPLSPQPGAVPAATPLPTPAATPVAAAPAGTPGWLWALGGAAGMALMLGAFWALRRRRPVDEAFEAAPEPVAVPESPVRAPPPGLAPPGVTPRAAPARPQAPPPAAAPASNPDDPFELAVRPLRVELGADQVELEIELLIGNRQSAAAEAVRPALALISANPDQDRQIAAFLANPLAESGGQPFDLAAGAGGRMAARLRVRREHIHVVEVGGRPMFVPVVMVALRWRGGLSIRRFGAAFMVGTAGQGAKLGPIWLDRAPAGAALAAMRYLPKRAPVAA